MGTYFYTLRTEQSLTAVTNVARTRSCFTIKPPTMVGRWNAFMVKQEQDVSRLLEQKIYCSSD